MTAMLTADWFLLSRDIYYRKFEIYSMKWQQEVNLDNVIASVATYGGPIAIIRDNKKILKVHGSGKPVIAIYSGSGTQMSSLVWKYGQPVTLGWSHQEHLLCIQEDGSVYIHDMFGNYKHMFRIEKEPCDVIDAKIFTNMQGTGIAIMTSTFKIHVINNVYDAKKYELHDVPSSCKEPATAWCVANVLGDRHTSVLVARGRELYRLSAPECKPLYPDMPEHWSNGPGKISEMAVSSCGRYLALLVNGIHLWLGPADCSTRYCELQILDAVTNSSISRQLAWCGSEAVILSYGVNVTVYGRLDGDAVTYAYDTAVRLCPEIDGVRIVSGAQHEFVQQVPSSVQKIFRINSTDPGSFLLEASRQYQKRSHRADEYVCLVRNKLREAVEQCVKAAGHEFDTDIQKMLIRAAQFGRCFLAAEDLPENKSPVDDYVSMCRKLRVLNALRDPRIGLPLTNKQYEALAHEALLDRLVARKHFRLAIEVARHLRLPDKDGASRILTRWAKYKVSQQQQHGAADEDALAKEIADKVGGGGVSFSEIALAAAEGGRSRLAIRLLDHEPRARLQVPLLLQLSEAKQALAKSIESGDTDLVYTVILSMKESMPLADFRLTIRNYPAAQALYKKYCREHNLQGLREIHAQEDDWCAQADTHVREAIDGSGDGLAREASLISAFETYKKGKSDLHASLCEESAKLVRAQRTIEQSHLDLRGKLSNTSVHETCAKLLCAGEIKAADRLRTDFKIPERRYWWLRARSLAQRGDWTELEKLSRSKKSPIGYGPFVDVCLEEGNREEAIKYVPRVAEELKVKYYIKAGLLEEGSRIAFEQRSNEGLLHVQRRALTINNTQLVQQINQYITQLSVRTTNK